MIYISPYHYLEVLCILATWRLWRLLRSTIVKCRVKLPGPQRAAYFFGNFKQIFDLDHGMEFQEHVASYGGAVKIHGICGDEQVYISDPRALHHILVKDQDIFEESHMTIQWNRLLFGYSLPGTIGAHHKEQRKMLNPVFSTKHMRSLTPLFFSLQLRDILVEKERVNECAPVNMSDWISRVSNEYAHCVRELIPILSSLEAYVIFLPLLVKLGPPSFRRFLVKLAPSRRIQRVKDIIDTMYQTSQIILGLKKHALSQGDEAVLKQVGEGKDIISVLREHLIPALSKLKFSD